MKRIFNTKRRVWTGIIALVVVLGIVWYALAKSHTSAQPSIAVQQGSITETVSVTGNTTSTNSVSLAFQNGGTIAQVYHQAGDTVHAGDVIASIDTSALQAQLEEAQANVDTQQADLAKLQAGPTAASVNVSQANLAAAQQTLQNAYDGVSNVVADSYAKANDAVRNQISSLFTSAETVNPHFNLTISDTQTINNAQFERVQASTALNAWQSSIASTSPQSSEADLDASLQNAATYISTMKQLLTTVAYALTETTNLSQTAAATYQTDVTAALNEVNTASTNITNSTQNIASEKSAVAQSQAELSLALATSTPEDLAAQQAQVEQAQASAASVEVSIRQAQIVSPIDGVITVQNAKVGQIASPGAPVVSIISQSQFEVDAYIPEVDIGKVAVDDPVSMTFDAFPGETFTGKVFYENPGETVVQGVVEYEIKISFDQADPRMKSGLTADCLIATQTKTGALILPQYAVIQNNSGTFVDTLENGKTVQVPVTLGIQDASGNVEITSGVTEGEQVLNIGLKTQ